MAVWYGQKVAGTESIGHVYQKKFATRGTSFEFSKVAWLQYLEKMLDVLKFYHIVRNRRYHLSILAQLHPFWTKVNKPRLLLLLRALLTIMTHGT